MGNIISIMSVKGGVGKTTVTANLGTALAELDKKVLLIDTNLSAPNLGLHLGIIDPENTLHDVLERAIPISEAVCEYNSNLHIISGFLAPKKYRINSVELKKMIDQIKDQYDIVLLDTSPALSEDIPAVLFASDEVLIVTTPDYPTLNCTIQAVKSANEEGKTILGLVLNKVINRYYELTIEDIEKATEIPVMAVIKYHKHFLKSVAETIPVVKNNPNKKHSIEYMKLAASLVGEDYKDPRFFHRLVSSLKRNKPKQEVNRELLNNTN